ncbi:MAG: lytic transglycosylase domain-containing protein [Pseudonocardiaceae bacterium]
MTDPDSQDHPPEARPPLVFGRRTRVAAAVVGALLSLGVPVAVLGAPVLTADGSLAAAPDDPAGLGITGTLPGDPLAVEAPDTLPEQVFGDSVGAGLSGIPTPLNLPDGPLGIPGVALDAYQFAERTLAATRPGCHLSWSVLAGIGRIESGHASAGRVDAYGNTLGPILGPKLDGSPGIAAIPDTDHGTLDTDTVWDRAMGPMQFIPSTWRGYGADGNGDGVANPNNIYDSTVAAGLYLCAGSADLADPAQLPAAVFRYNHSASYVDIVLRWAQAYLRDVIPTPSAPGRVPAGTNGNGGVPVVPESSLLAAAPPAPVTQVVQVVPLPPTPSPTPALSPTPSPEPPAAITTPPLPTTPSPTPSATPTPLPGTTSPEATSSSPPSESPTATPTIVPSPTPSASPTVPVEPGSSPLPAPSPTPSPSPTIAPAP